MGNLSVNYDGKLIPVGIEAVLKERQATQLAQAVTDSAAALAKAEGAEAKALNAMSTAGAASAAAASALGTAENAQAQVNAAVSGKLDVSVYEANMEELATELTTLTTGITNALAKKADSATMTAELAKKQNREEQYIYKSKTVTKGEYPANGAVNVALAIQDKNGAELGHVSFIDHKGQNKQSMRIYKAAFDDNHEDAFLEIYANDAGAVWARVCATGGAQPKLPSPLPNDMLTPYFFVRDTLRAEIEAVSSGRNTVVRDANGNPHIMVVFPRFRLEDIDASLGTGTHPAFIVNGITKSEILIGKYPASRGSGDVPRTLPRCYPWTSVLLDDTIARCRALGSGFGLCTSVMYAARALWLWKHFGGATSAHTYHGNSNYGRSYFAPWQTGTLSYVNYPPGDTGAWSGGKSSYTRTGSGPLEWHDDETPFGVCDLAGNVREFAAGLRLNNGEINIIPNNDAMLAATSMATDSASWKALAADGSLVAPGTANTLKYDASEAQTATSGYQGEARLNTTIANATKGALQTGKFREMTAASGVTVPALARVLGLFPLADNVQGGISTDQRDERLALATSGWDYGSSSGPFALQLTYSRADGSRSVGFRVAYVS